MPLFNKSLFKLFFTFWIIYLTFARIDGWVENSRLDLTRAIVDEGRFEIDSYVNNTGDRAYYNGHYYTEKFPGGSFIAVPPYFVFKHIFGTPSINDNFYSLNPNPAYNFMVFFVIMFTSALFSALTVVLVYKTAGFFTDKKSHKYIAAIAYGLGTIAFNYATLFYDHAISTFFSFACFYLVFKMSKEGGEKYYFLAGILGGFAIITSPLTFIIIFGCFIFVLLTKKLKNILNFSIGCFLILLILFSYNFI
ncbi:MAG: glycosyltransferase family 39 protein, partial [Nanoarchaeota archaeon]|nr:glycosyltransferase family 39 protein [Nanoarchaeota archaeon]